MILGHVLAAQPAPRQEGLQDPGRAPGAAGAPPPWRICCPAGVSFGDARVGDVLYRNATATGTYIADRTITVENRTDASDQPGAWVLTPLDIGDGRAVLVNRGFLGYDVQGRIVPAAAARRRGERTAGSCSPPRRGASSGPRTRRPGCSRCWPGSTSRRVDAQVDEQPPPGVRPDARPAARAGCPRPGRPGPRGAGPPRHQRSGRTSPTPCSGRSSARSPPSATACCCARSPSSRPRTSPSPAAGPPDDEDVPGPV